MGANLKEVIYEHYSAATACELSSRHNADKTVKSYQSFLHERPMIVLTVGLTMAVEAL